MFLLPIYFLFLVCSPLVVCSGNADVIKRRYGPIPPFWDWRDFNAVSPVRNQGNCTAGWAFSVVACVESHVKIYLDRDEILSEQFLLDCEPSGVGCNSTSVYKAFGRIVNDLYGVLRQSVYTPYASKKQTCSRKTMNPLPVPVPMLGYRRVEPYESIMMKYVYRHGPLSAAINSASMKKYAGGVDNPTDELCPADKTDHAVLIVGYKFLVDPETGLLRNYWIIKNSWGEKWGDKGYYYLVLGRNACGIATDVSFPYV